MCKNQSLADNTSPTSPPWPEYPHPDDTSPRVRRFIREWIARLKRLDVQDPFIVNHHLTFRGSGEMLYQSSPEDLGRFLDDARLGRVLHCDLKYRSPYGLGLSQKQHLWFYTKLLINIPIFVSVFGFCALPSEQRLDSSLPVLVSVVLHWVGATLLDSDGGGKHVWEFFKYRPYFDETLTDYLQWIRRPFTSQAQTSPQ